MWWDGEGRERSGDFFFYGILRETVDYNRFERNVPNVVMTKCLFILCNFGLLMRVKPSFMCV
jgi:hypothetical protein